MYLYLSDSASSAMTLTSNEDEDSDTDRDLDDDSDSGRTCALLCYICGVDGREVECRPHNLNIVSLIPRSGYQLGFSLAYTFGVSTGVVQRKHCRPHNLNVPSLTLRSGCQLWDFHWPTHLARLLVYFQRSIVGLTILTSQVQFPGVGVNFGIFIGPHILQEYWCSFQEAESREISNNLFLN